MLKLKPLMKTHWVASQNPLNVSLHGLKRVIFSPPDGLLCPDFSTELSPAVVLPVNEGVVAENPVSINELQEIRSQRMQQSTDLFWRYFSGHDMGRSMESPSNNLKSLVQSIEFHFEDGRVLPLPGIFRQPGFPLFLDPKFYFQDSSCNWERITTLSADEWMKPLKMVRHLKRSEELRRTWFVLLEIMAWALQRKRQVGDLEVLYRSRNDSPHKAFHLEEIEMHKELPLAATVTNEKGALHSARIRVWQGLSEAAPTGVLRLHAADVVAELENYFLGPVVSAPTIGFQDEPSREEMECLQAGTKLTHWQPRFSSLEAGARSILKSLSHLEKSIGSGHVIFVNHLLVSASNFKPRLRLKNSEGSMLMSVSFQISQLGIEHLNLPENCTPLLAPFSGGLDQVLKVERKDVASRHKQYRAQDLLFLRHQGLLIFSLFEMINWVLKKPLSSGQEIEFIDDLESPQADQQFEKLIQYLQGSIPALLGKPDVPFKELVSPQAQGLFLEYLEKLFHHLMQDRSILFHQNQVVEIRNVQAKVLPILRFMILHFIENSRGKFLLRAQSPLGDKFQSSVAALSSSDIIPLGAHFHPMWVDLGSFDQQTIAMLFELCDEDMDVELNGTPLLNQSNPFDFVFNVKDSAIEEDGNWFDLHPQIFFNGTRVSNEDVKINFGQGHTGFIEYQGLIYRIDKALLPSLKSLQRFWNKIKALRRAGDKNKFGDNIYHLNKSQALELLMLKTQGFQVHVEGEWKRIFEYFENGLGTEKINFPALIEKNLLPHQKEGAQWLHDLYQLRLGAILADEMGLGKTFQVLSFLASLQMQDQLGKSLIIVPTSLVYNWIDEKNKFAPDLPMRVYHPSQEPDLRKALKSDEPLILITTYGFLIENSDFFQSQEWNVLAIDEAQALKNITSQRAVAARKIRARFKVCVTGTPMENNYFEFYSLCDLVVPGCLGDVDAFRREYVNREVRSESLRDLKLVSKPLLLRRTKVQVNLSLPEKTVQKVSLPFGVQQKEIYKKMAMTFSRQVEALIQDQGERKAQIAMFAALMRLRQICSDPAAVPGVVYQEQPAKVEHFLSSLQEHLENQESVIVFTQFLSTLGRIERELEKVKVPTYTLKGSVSAKERLRLISAFQESPQPGVMLMTLKTGGVGLNLTKASVVYHLEPWWNPAVENQATDRAHRMGQTKNVKVFNLLIEGSLEERIADLKLKKQASFDRLFGVEEEIDGREFEGGNSLTREDFMYLLK
jgi:SNF2 family DNA or RNA helicase